MDTKSVKEKPSDDEPEERLKPISMHPASIEDALRAAMSTPPPNEETNEEEKNSEK